MTTQKTDEPMILEDELIILKADTPQQHELNWTVREYVGLKVSKDNDNIPLQNESDLTVGDTIYVPGYGSYVVRSDNGRLYAENDRWHILLDFAKDDRKCWVCSGFINKRGIAAAK